jgi:hypothetical protein
MSLRQNVSIQHLIYHEQSTSAEPQILSALNASMESWIVPGLNASAESLTLPGLNASAEPQILSALNASMESWIVPGLNASAESLTLAGLNASSESSTLPGHHATTELPLFHSMEQLAFPCQIESMDRIGSYFPGSPGLSLFSSSPVSSPVVSEQESSTDYIRSDSSGPSLWCLMCGAQSDPVRCHYITVSIVQDDVRARCVPTSFHYAAVMAMQPEVQAPICLHCVNWRRYSRRGLPIQAPVRVVKRKTYTPLDGYGCLSIEYFMCFSVHMAKI